MRVVYGLFVLVITVSFSLAALSAPETPLEQQIRDLEGQLYTSEWQINPDIKEQLNELYAERPENQRPGGDPLDQGTDLCPGTFIPSLPFTDTGTTVGYTDNYDPSCSGGDAPDVVYYFVAANAGCHTVSLCGSSFDAMLYVIAGDCGSSEIACNDDFCGLQSQVTFDASVGTNYIIIVDGFSTFSGTYMINVVDSCAICTVEYQTGDIVECAETPGESHASEDCNGGCNNPWYGGTNTMQEITCGQTVYGVSFNYTGPDGAGLLSDLDYYRFTLAEACTVQVTVEAEFPIGVSIAEPFCNSEFWDNETPTCTREILYNNWTLPFEYVLTVRPLAPFLYAEELSANVTMLSSRMRG